MSLSQIDSLFYEFPSPSWIFELESLEIKEVNSAALTLYGYSKEEMLSLTIEDLRPKEDVPKLNEFLKKDFRINRNPGVWKHLTKDRKTIYVNISYNIIKIDKKEFVLTTVNDVTMLKDIEKRYWTAQKILDQIIEKLPGTFFVLNSRGELLRWNLNTEIISGYSHKEISGMKALDFFTSREKRKIYAAIKKALEEGHTEIQSEVLTKSGDQIPFYFNLSLVRVDGEKQIIGIGVDISNMIEAQNDAIRHQKLLQAIIDQTGSVIYIKNEEGTFRFVNRGFLNLFNLESKEVIGRKDTDILRGDEAKQICLNDEKVRSNRKPIQIEEQIQIDGETRTFLSTKLLLSGIENYENCVFGISNDITDRIRIEEKLRESLQEKEILLKEIHHRVKNNLAVITGIMELQAMEHENFEYKDQIRETQGRIQSIALTHELLYQAESFSRIQFDESIKRQTFSISNTFNSSVKFEFELEQLTLNVNQALPSSLILNELITNALKHAFKDIDNPIIKIKLSHNRENVSLSVEDNGIGLPQDFDIDSSSTLGMKLVNILTKQLNGELEVKSNLGAFFKLKFKKSDIGGIGSSIVDDIV